ncbi:MAG TPA: M48 family metallopeptidase [Candidatus Acidoferrales bacterium]|nr:M48 family metallopeptidase [Candidatus Acidoferrales bacterium]
MLAKPLLRQRTSMEHTPRAAPALCRLRGATRGLRLKRPGTQTAAFCSAIFPLVAAVLLFAPPGRAQQPKAPATSQSPSPAPAPPGTRLPDGQGQVQGYTLTPGQEAQAIAYARARHELYFLDVAYGLLLLVLLLQFRVAPAFRDRAVNWTNSNFGQIVIFTAMLLVTIDVLSLPAAIWGHRLAVHYQQSIQGWGSWLVDWAIEEAVEITIGILLIGILFAVIRKSPRKWWFWFWLAAVPLIVLGAVIEPLVVEPLFYKFTPLASAQPRLAENIERMTIRAGAPIPQSRILEMNASTKLNELNAYVSGLGASKRVVVWDTTIRRMSEDEVLFVSGHEMGHYVLGHERDAILFACAVLLFFLYLAYRAVHAMLARWGAGWAIRGPDDLAALPALILLVTVFGFLFTPISNAYSRHLEHQADQYGLEVIHGLIPDAPIVAAHAFQVLGEVDLEEPNPSTAVKFWFYNHPPLDERMRFAQTYDPWSQGRAPEFVTGAGSTWSPPN